MKKLLAVLLFAAIAAASRATTLTGVIRYSNGNPVTGTLSLAVSKRANLLTTGSCGGPATYVPTQPKLVTITSGSPPGGTTVPGVDCLSPSNVVYAARLIDSNGKVIIDEWWPITGGSTDIGSILPLLSPALNPIPLNGDVTGDVTADFVSRLQGSPLSVVSPVTGNVLKFNGTTWVNGSVSGTGTVTSIDLTAPGPLVASGGPITAGGTLALAWSNFLQNGFLAGPCSGGPGAPAVRLLCADDVPAIPESRVTGLTADLATKALSARVLTAGAGLTGGGDLTADRSFAVPSGGITDGMLASGVATAATPGTLVKRDGGGGFSGTLTGDVTGNVAGNLTGNVAGNVIGNLAGNVTGNVSGSSASFTGPLAGDVTGTQGATAVALIGGSTAGNVHAAELLANAATAANTASTIVKRDGSGNFAAGTITASSHVGPLTGNVTGDVLGNLTGAVTGHASLDVPLARTLTATAPLTVDGGASADLSANRTLALTLSGGGGLGTSGGLGIVGAGVVDGMLATPPAVTANVNSLVKRDGSASFAANVITAQRFSGPADALLYGNGPLGISFVASQQPHIGYIPLADTEFAAHWAPPTEIAGVIFGAVINLQNATPGTTQTGHGHISGTFIAGQFVGPLTGDVVGNVTGHASQDALASRQIICGNALTGCGDLTADRTLVVTTSPAAQTPVGVTRSIATTAPLAGGGNLSADRTLSLAITPANSGGAVALQATTPGTTQSGNFNVDGTGLVGNITVAGETATDSLTVAGRISTTAPIFGATNFLTSIDLGGNDIDNVDVGNFNTVEAVDGHFTGGVGIGTAPPASGDLAVIGTVATAYLIADSSATPDTTSVSVTASGNGNAVEGYADAGQGASFHSNSASGVQAFSNSGVGLTAQSTSGTSALFRATNAANAEPTVVTKQQGAATADLFQAQLNGGAAVVTIGLGTNPTLSVGPAGDSATAGLFVQNNSSNPNPNVVIRRGPPDLAVHLLEFQSQSSALFTYFDFTGVFHGTVVGDLAGNATTSSATSALKTTGASVDVAGSAPPPGAGYSCITTNATHCTWQLAGAGGVTLQGSTPGTPDSGNFNVDGAGLVGNLIAASSTATAIVATGTGQHGIEAFSDADGVVGTGANVGVQGVSDFGTAIAGSSNHGASGSFGSNDTSNTTATLIARQVGSDAAFANLFEAQYSDGTPFVIIADSTDPALSVTCSLATAIAAFGTGQDGIDSISDTAIGVFGSSGTSTGVMGYSTNGFGVLGQSYGQTSGMFQSGNPANVSPTLVVRDFSSTADLFQTQSSVGTALGLTVTANGHAEYGSSLGVPGLGTCGSGAAIIGNDNVGQITTGSGSPTACVITFTAAWTNPPICVVQATAAAGVYNVGVTSTTTTVTFSGGFGTGQSYGYICRGWR